MRLETKLCTGLSYRISPHSPFLSSLAPGIMAYQFFAKGQRASTSSPSSPSPVRSHPPLHPLPVQPPRSAATKARPNQASQEELTPYPHGIPAGYATPHPHVTVETVSTGHIPSLARITGLLLPIRYPNSFYTATITDPVVASLSRVAIYHDHPVAAAPDSGASAGADKVIGGIRCRLEKPDPTHGVQDPEATNLYIQTLHLLSPYRGQGVAAALLNSLLFEVPPGGKAQPRISGLVKHYNIRSVTAHVHEANEDALKWYVTRGFKIQEGVVKGYYRRLKPSGAKIVRLDVQWEGNDLQHHGDEYTKDAPQATFRSGLGDDDWEKVEMEDGEEGYHNVQPLSESLVLQKDDTPSKKRKAEDDKGNKPQRR